MARDDLSVATRSGPGRVLIAVYAVFAVAATSRSAVRGDPEIDDVTGDADLLRRFGNRPDVPDAGFIVCGDDDNKLRWVSPGGQLGCHLRGGGADDGRELRARQGNRDVFAGQR